LKSAQAQVRQPAPAPAQQTKAKKETQPQARTREPEVVIPKTTQPPPGIEAPDESQDSEEYLELHNTISGRSFNSKVAQVLTEVVDIVSENAFFNIAHVAKSGSIGKGTAINGCTDAEVVFFVQGFRTTSRTSGCQPC
jgi:hypothetical protein